MSVDYFLKIDTIDGESEDHAHKGEIELASFTWDESQPGTFSQGGGGGAGKVRMNNFDFKSRVGKASPKLMLACATGQHIPSAKLTCRKAGGGQQEFYAITLTDVLVSSYKTTSTDSNGNGNGNAADNQGGYDEGVPVDYVGLNFAKIQAEYRPQKEDGSLDNPIKVGYSLKENKTV